MKECQHISEKNANCIKNDEYEAASAEKFWPSKDPRCPIQSSASAVFLADRMTFPKVCFLVSAEVWKTQGGIQTLPPYAPPLRAIGRFCEILSAEVAVNANLLHQWTSGSEITNVSLTHVISCVSSEPAWRYNDITSECSSHVNSKIWKRHVLTCFPVASNWKRIQLFGDGTPAASVAGCN